MEKINIFVPEHIQQLLENDARQFEIFKKDMQTMNMNRFLSMLIAGYYNSYTEHYKEIHSQITSILQKNGMSDLDSLHASASSVYKTVIAPEAQKKKGVLSKKISLKPTALTEPILLYLDDVLDGDSVSQYFCRMFMTYAQNPLNIRERIVFKDTCDLLQTACKSGQSVSFVTNRNPESIHEVKPYSVSVGKEELYNYLLCQEWSKESNVYKTATYRLSRIAKARLTDTISVLSEDVRRHLDEMQKYGPQYEINDDDEACVQLTEEGIRLFHQIYFGRPTVKRIESKKGKTFYYFMCSKNQLYLYFRRFGADHAIVLYPESLRHKIIDFHKEALDAYLTHKKHT